MSTRFVIKTYQLRRLKRHLIKEDKIMSEENVNVTPSETPSPAPQQGGTVTLRNGREVPNRNSGNGSVGPNGAPARRKRYWWRYLLFFFGGFFACIGVIVGGVAITGTVLKARDVITMIGQNPDEILGIEYQNQTLLNLIQTLTTKKFETLGDINKVTPMVKKTIDNDLNPILKENLHYELNWEELSIKPFTVNPNSTRPATEYDKNESLGEYIPRALKSGITLASFVDATGEATGILQYFLYPKNGDAYDKTHPYSIADFMQDNFFQNLIDGLKIGEVIPDIANNPFLAQMADWGINDFTDEKVKSLTLTGLFTDADKEANPLLAKIESWSIADFATIDQKINDFKISEIINTTGAEGLLAAIKDKTIAEIKDPEFINTLKLKDIMPNLTSADGIMYTLAITHNYSVGDLKNESSIMALKLNELITVDSSSFLNNYGEKTLEELKTLSTADIHLTDIFSNTEIEGNPILKGLVANNPNVSVADLSNYDTIAALKLSSVLTNDSNNQVLAALFAKETTISSISTDINTLTLKEVVDCGTDTESILYKIAHSDALINTPINELGTNFGQITVGTLLTVDSTSPQIVKTLNNVKLDDLGDFMNDLSAKDVIEIIVGDAYKDMSVNPFDFYVKVEGEWTKVSDAVRDEEIEDYLGENGYVAKGLATVYEGMGAPTSSTHPEAKSRDSLYGIRDTKISNSNDLIVGLKNNLKLKDVVEIDASSPQVLQSLSNVKLNDIPDVLTTLTLSEVINIDDSAPQILKSLANVTVFGETDNLQSALVNLKFNNYFTEADCSSGILKALWDSTTPGGDFLLSDVASKINNLKLVDVLEDQIFEKDSSDQYIYDPTHTYKKIKASWWFLLTEEKLTDFPEEERFFQLRDGKNYTMNDMGKLVSNMEFHMKNETIFNLIDAEFIIVNDATKTKLNQTIPFGEHAGKKYGDLTIKEFLETAAALLP